MVWNMDMVMWLLQLILQQMYSSLNLIQSHPFAATATLLTYHSVVLGGRSGEIVHAA